MRRNEKETPDEWHARIMRETEGMTRPGDVVAHLAADAEKNGLPPARPEVQYETPPPPGAIFDRCPLDGTTVDGGDPCEGCPGYGPECGALWRPPVEGVPHE